MSANRPDISYIRKYLNGELDARAMYKLEREAQDDPFLMDMIKGMEDGNEADHQANLHAIDELIKKRVNQQQRKRVIPLYRYWSAAACLLIALGIGSWWYTHQTSKTLVADNIAPTKPAPKITALSPQQVIKPAAPLAQSKTVAANKFEPPVVIKPSAEAAVVSAPPVIVNDIKVDTAADKIAYNKPNALKEVTIVGYATQRKQTVTASVSSVESKDLSKKSADSVNVIAGKVVDETGQPLPGVTVKAKNSPIMTATDAQGNYKIRIPDNNTVLDFIYIGYESKELLAKNNTPANVAMQPNNSSLNEVVVVGYGSPKKSNAEPRPANGQKNYDEYIDEEAVMPDGTTGSVKVAFDVNTNGTITNIHIVSGSNKAMNDKAIEIIKDGPKWIGGTRTKEIKLKIRFHK